MIYSQPLRVILKSIRNLFFPISPDQIKYQPDKWIAIEISNVCNSKCIFCIHRHTKRKKAFMPINDFREIVQSCRRLGYEGLGFSAFGEVFTHKDAVEIICAAKDAGFKNMETHTNGIGLYRYDIEKLLNSGLDILSISFPGFGREPFVRIFGVDKYEEFKRSVKILLETHRKINSKVRISFLPRTYLTKKQIQESEFYTQFVADYLRDRINICDPTKVFDTWGGAIKRSDMVNGMKLDINPLKSLYPFKKPFLCVNLLSYGVTVNGDVRVCNCKYDYSIETPEDPFLVGNIWDYESMEDLIKRNTAKVKKILSNFRNGNMPSLCKECTMYTPVDPIINNFNEINRQV